MIWLSLGGKKGKVVIKFYLLIMKIYIKYFLGFWGKYINIENYCLAEITILRKPS